MAVAGLRVDLVPPAQADEATAGNVLEVVEVGGQQEDGENEDEDPRRKRERGNCQGEGGADRTDKEGGCRDARDETYLLAVKSRPKR